MLLFITDFPARVFALSLILLSGSVLLSHVFFRHRQSLGAELRETFSLIQSAALTLLALFVGFSFSMGIAHYDARSTAEEAEANAIQTAFLRLDFLHSSQAKEMQNQLTQYLALRIKHYPLRAWDERRIAEQQAWHKGKDMWQSLHSALLVQPDTLKASLGDALTTVLGAIVSKRSAWDERIPPEAWALMLIIAIGCCTLAGYGAQHTRKGITLTLILPIVIAFSFMLIADIDSTQSGLIDVEPSNLAALLLRLENNPT